MFIVAYNTVERHLDLPFFDPRASVPGKRKVSLKDVDKRRRRNKLARASRRSR
jgi:hypothetical protein